MSAALEPGRKPMHIRHLIGYCARLQQELELTKRIRHARSAPAHVDRLAADIAAAEWQILRRTSANDAAEPTPQAYRLWA